MYSILKSEVIYLGSQTILRCSISYKALGEMFFNHMETFKSSVYANILRRKKYLWDQTIYLLSPSFPWF